MVTLMENVSDNKITLHKGHLWVDWIVLNIQFLQNVWPQKMDTGYSKIS